jgi:hypothetical protein
MHVSHARSQPSLQPAVHTALCCCWTSLATQLTTARPDGSLCKAYSCVLVTSNAHVNRVSCVYRVYRPQLFTTDQVGLSGMASAGAPFFQLNMQLTEADIGSQHVLNRHHAQA